MSYDATLTILIAAKRELTGSTSKTSPVPVDLFAGLRQIHNAQAVQGVSGQISFDSHGNLADKAMVIAKISPQGFIQIDSVIGCFQVGTCPPSSS